MLGTKLIVNSTIWGPNW